MANMPFARPLARRPLTDEHVGDSPGLSEVRARDGRVLRRALHPHGAGGDAAEVALDAMALVLTLGRLESGRVLAAVGDRRRLQLVAHRVDAARGMNVLLATFVIPVMFHECSSQQETSRRHRVSH